jgi:hypothetical protein
LAINFSTSIWKKFSEFSMTLSHSRAMTYVARKNMGWVNKWWKHIKGWDVGSQLQVDVWDCNWTQIWWHLRWQYTWTTVKWPDTFKLNQDVCLITQLSLNVSHV